MKEYEVSFKDKDIGKVTLYIDNINNDLSNSLMISNNTFDYKLLGNNDIQQYLVTYTINSIDDLYKIVSKFIYSNEEIIKYIDKLKKDNSIKEIKKNTRINIIIPEIYLNNLNISKNNIDKDSLLKSKVYFIKNVIDKNGLSNISNILKTIVSNYKNYKSNNEYEFLTDEEKELIISKCLNELDKLISEIEESTNYKYGRDFIIPIKVID